MYAAVCLRISKPMPRKRTSVCSHPGCPNLVVSAGRCPAHGRRDTSRRASRQERGYDREYELARDVVMSNATTCYLCGEGPRPDDPLTADHVDPAIRSGPGLQQNLKPAHASCNARKGNRVTL